MTDESGSATLRGRELLWAAALVRAEAIELGLAAGAPTSEPIRLPERRSQFDTVVRNPRIRKAAERLYGDGHYARSVEEAFKSLNNLVKDRSGLTGADGDALMRTALSPNNPVLKLNEGSTQSQRDEQAGYMDIFAGSMKGIRNPRAHDHEFEDYPSTALELLSLASHLADRAEAARRVRGKKGRRSK